MTYYIEHSKVWVSVDVIIFGFDEQKLKVLIGRRQMDPGRGEWSLYGGFVAADESIDDAAKRTLETLTGLNNLYMRQVGAFGSIDRDPGERVISIAYYALINVKDYDEKLRQDKKSRLPPSVSVYYPNSSPSHNCSVSMKPLLAKKLTNVTFVNALRKWTSLRRQILSIRSHQNVVRPYTGSIIRPTMKIQNLNYKEHYVRRTQTESI